MKHPYLVKLRFLLLLVLGLTASLGAWAQAGTGTVNGRVTDAKNEGLPGVTVLVEGTSVGGSTNADGTYTISGVPAGSHTLIISFVGYATSRVPVTVRAGQTITVAAQNLSENATALGEAVVVGYGTQRRQDITGSVATVDSKQFVPGQITTPEQLIQGKVAGVSITTGGGAPGSANTVRIRGASSLNANNDPLYVIDGVPVDKDGISGASNPLSLINPNDIETFTVLKDASATAIYGNRASNGVILITTKRGSQGDKLHVDLSSQTSLSQAARRYPTISADQFRSLVTANGSPSQVALIGSADTNWQDQIFRNAATYDNNISFTGSAGKVPYRVSYGNLYQQGVVITNSLTRNSGSVSLTPRLLDDHLRIDVNAKGTWVDNRFVDNGQISNAASFDPTQPVTSSAPQYQRFGGYFQWLQPSGSPLGLAPGNPVAALNNTRNVSTVRRLLGNVQVDYKVHGIEGLRANVNLGLDIARGRGNTTINSTDFGTYNGSAPTNPLLNGSYSPYAQDKDMRLLEAYLAYAKQFGELKFDVQGGYSYQSFVNQGPNFLTYRLDNTTTNPPGATLTVPGYYNKLVLESYFGRINFNYADKYLVTGTVRNDYTSRFIDPLTNKARGGWFPAVGVAWRVKNEAFLKDSKALTEFKFRGGYGRTGQQDIGGYYDQLPLYVLGTSTAQYLFGNNPQITSRPSGYNSNLTWETTDTYNVGLDLGFMENRLTLTADVYQRTSSNLLANINVAAGANLTNQLNANIGSLRNRGVELAINYGLVRSDNFNWDINLNGAYNQNQITNLGLQQENFIGYQVGGVSGGTGTTVQVNRVGQPANSFLVLQQAYSPNGRPLEGVFVDRNGDGVINNQDLYTYKQPVPPVTLGFSSTTSYRKLSLAFVLRANIGNYLYNNPASGNGTLANARGSTGYLINPNPDVLNTMFTTYSTNTFLSDYYVQNASFLRAENITLGYNVGKIFSNSATLRLTANVQNAFVITKYTGTDPEVAGGLDNNFYPRPRTYTFGLALGF